VRPEALDKQLSTFKRPSAAHIKAEQDWANGEVIDKYLSWAIRAAQTVGRACNDHPQISRSPHSPAIVDLQRRLVGWRYGILLAD